MPAVAVYNSMRIILSENYKRAQMLPQNQVPVPGAKAPLSNFQMKPDSQTEKVNLPPNPIVPQIVRLIAQFNPEQANSADLMEMTQAVSALVAKLRTSGVQFHL